MWTGGFALRYHTFLFASRVPLFQGDADAWLFYTTVQPTSCDKSRQIVYNIHADVRRPCVTRLYRKTVFCSCIRRPTTYSTKIYDALIQMEEVGHFLFTNLALSIVIIIKRLPLLHYGLTLHSQSSSNSVVSRRPCVYFLFRVYPCVLNIICLYKFNVYLLSKLMQISNEIPFRVNPKWAVF